MINTHSDNSNISQLEEYIYSIIRGTVSDHIYVDTAPTVTNVEWDDMVIIDCSLPITDYGSHGSGTVYIELYARPAADGSKNVYRLAQMERALNVVLDSVSDATYSLVRENAHAGYDTKTTWHYNSIMLDVTINH